MSRCAYVSPETATRCPFEAEANRRYCRGCEQAAFQELARFGNWMGNVAVALEALCGLHPDDLPDSPYADWYTAGTTPEDAARQCLARFLVEDDDA